MKKLVLLNIYSFLFWLISLSLSNFDLGFFRYLLSFSALIITLVLVGINLTAIIQLFNPKQFSKIEILSIASILALIVSPLLVTLEYTFLKYLSPSLPFINSLAIFILLLILRHKKKRIDLENFDFLSLRINKATPLNLIKSPFLLAFLIQFSSIIIIFSAFYALPELDPYYWYATFQETTSQGMLTLLSGHRPFFMSLIYILNQSAKVDLYAIFKYTLPLLTLSVLIPAYLTATKFRSGAKKLLILLLPLISASAFLYSQMPIPQTLLNITLYYFTFFLLYSWITKDSLFYFLSGTIIILTYLYHESAILIILIWCAITILFYGKKIIEMAKKNILASSLAIIIFILNFIPLIKPPFNFLIHNLKSIPLPGSSSKINLLFPAQYTNIDGIFMGWEGWLGVAKYYTYYVGPFLLILLAYFLFLFFRDKPFRDYAKKALFSKEILVLVVAFLCFFSISEIFPRISNVAFLPERAWAFSGILSILFLILIFKHKPVSKILYTLMMFSFFVNLGGSFYINNIKKNIVTLNDLNSAEWIKNNLPENRIVFSSTNQGAMRLYSHSIIIGIPDEFYYDTEIYQKNIKQFKYEIPELDTEFSNLAKEMTDNISDLKKYNVKNQKEKIATMLKENDSLIKKALGLLSFPNNENDHNLYIYYSKLNSDNPYIGRPYYKKRKLQNKDMDFIFDQHPDKFQRIYNNKTASIIIWKIL